MENIKRTLPSENVSQEINKNVLVHFINNLFSSYNFASIFYLITRYLIYKKKLYNMDANGFPKIASNFSQNLQLRLKWGWHKDVESWLDHWGIKRRSSCRIQIISKIILLPNLKINWGKIKSWKEKRKVKYYKEVINPHLENQNYLYVLTSVKMKMNISNIITNSHELHGEIRHWWVLKIPWDLRVYHLCRNWWILKAPWDERFCHQ